MPEGEVRRPEPEWCPLQWRAWKSEEAETLREWRCRARWTGDGNGRTWAWSSVWMHDRHPQRVSRRRRSPCRYLPPRLLAAERQRGCADDPGTRDPFNRRSRVIYRLAVPVVFGPAWAINHHPFVFFIAAFKVWALESETGLAMSVGSAWRRTMKRKRC